MKRKPRRVKEQGSFLKRQLKDSERFGAFKQPWEGGGGPGRRSGCRPIRTFLSAERCCSRPSSPPFPSCRRILSNSRVRTQGTLLRFISRRLPPPRPRPVLGALITELPAQRAPNPRTRHPRDAGASSPSRGWHGQKIPPLPRWRPPSAITSSLREGSCCRDLVAAMPGGGGLAAQPGTWPRKMGEGELAP